MKSLLLPALAVGLVLTLEAPPVAAADDVRAEIARKLNIRVEDVRPAPLPGMFEVSNGAEVAYVSADGRYYLDGDLYDMDSKENVTDRRRAVYRASALAKVQDSDGVVFGPNEAKYTLNVFTDIDCGFCRRLHAEIGEFPRVGIRVRYLMWPRSGPGSPSWRKAEAIMCSKDRQDALTRAKRGEAISEQSCNNPVEKTYRLGQDLLVGGTPTFATEEGYLFSQKRGETVAQLAARAKSYFEVKR